MSPSLASLTDEGRPHVLVLYLPSQTREGREIPHLETIVENTERTLCAWFAGVTSYPAMGCYRKKSGETQREPIRVLECYCEAGDWEKNAAAVMELADALRQELAQESLAWALDGRLKVVE